MPSWILFICLILITIIIILYVILESNFLFFFLLLIILPSIIFITTVIAKLRGCHTFQSHLKEKLFSGLVFFNNFLSLGLMIKQVADERKLKRISQRACHLPKPSHSQLKERRKPHCVRVVHNTYWETIYHNVVSKTI